MFAPPSIHRISLRKIYKVADKTCPAKAGIHKITITCLDSRLRGNDKMNTFSTGTN